jgi:hypothetical protein
VGLLYTYRKTAPLSHFHSMFFSAIGLRDYTFQLEEKTPPLLHKKGGRMTANYLQKLPGPGFIQKNATTKKIKNITESKCWK